MAKAPEERIEVKSFIDRDELKRDVGYSNADLSTAMAEQASLFVHYGALAAEASRQVDQFKTRLSIAESAIYRTIRDKMTADGDKFSEPMLAAKVAEHPKIRQIKIAINEAKQVEATCKIAVEGFRHRRDMLIQQGLLSREEMKGELSVVAKRVAGEQREVQKDSLLARLKQIGQPSEEEA